MRQWIRAGVVSGSAAAAQARRAIAGPSHAASQAAPRILLVRPDHMGDVLLSTPAIGALHAALPSAHLAALVGPWAASVLTANPHIDAVHTLRFPGFERGAPAAGWQAYTLLAREAARLRAWRFDAAINLRADFWWGAALLALADVPLRIGFDVPPGARGLTHNVPRVGDRQHTTRQAWRLARATARMYGADLPAEDEIDPATAPLVFCCDTRDEQRATEWLAQHGILRDHPPIFVHPGSGAPVKLWPPQKWAETLDMLADDLRTPIVVAGTRVETEMVEAVVAGMRHRARAIACTEDMPLGLYAALLARARLVLGVDSGPLHLADAMGTPTVRLYGPTDPAVFGPWAPARSCATVVSDLPCAFCGRLDFPRSELPLHPCMTLLAPHAVVAAARSLLEQVRIDGRGRAGPMPDRIQTESVV